MDKMIMEQSRTLVKQNSTSIMLSVERIISGLGLPTKKALCWALAHQEIRSRQYECDYPLCWDIQSNQTQTIYQITLGKQRILSRYQVFALLFHQLSDA